MDNVNLTIEKLVHGGQGIGTLPDGRKAFVWNALPGEEVTARIIKKRRDYLEAVAEGIIKPSSERIRPLEDNYLSTSPWQIMTYEAENKYKHEIVNEVFAREHIQLPDFEFICTDQQYGYRNKMEYSFWGDEDGLHLALHQRGSRGKQIVTGSKLAMPAVDKAANAVLAEIQKHALRAGDMKTVIVRATQDGTTTASLFVKDEEFVKLALPAELKGLVVYFSNPKSPASVPTRMLYKLGDVTLTDTLLNKSFEYNSDSFFQVNLPIFEKALSVIKQNINGQPVVDMYGGVGSIGLSVSEAPIIVEIAEAAVTMAKRNAVGTHSKVVHTSTEKALEYIENDRLLILDPPRAGLHSNVIECILEVQPEKVIYLSCNPATQARDLKFLGNKYEIVFFEGYNFFPRTPHIETLAILQQK